MKYVSKEDAAPSRAPPSALVYVADKPELERISFFFLICILYLQHLSDSFVLNHNK